MKNPMRNSNKITSISELIEELGGPAKIAEASDELVRPTIGVWKKRDGVPPKFWHHFQKLALEKEIILTGDDYFRLHGMDVLTKFR